MKVFYSIVLFFIVLKSVQSENSAIETEEESSSNSSLIIDCHLNGSCIRLCSNKSSDETPDLKLIKGSEKLKKDFIIEYGRPCEYMFTETELWELVEVRKKSQYITILDSSHFNQITRNLDQEIFLNF